MTRRVLVIEDDPDIRSQTAALLRDEGYATIEAASGEEGLRAFEQGPADCVLLDVMLPDVDGFEVCRRIRAQSDVPILMVTARSDSYDVVAGLEAGADDYVPKPFEPKELMARIRAMLRRVHGFGSAPPVLVLADGVEIRPDEGTVTVRGEPVHLTVTEFRLLCELAAAPGRVFSREILLESVWGYDYVGDTKLVDVHVYRLRAKIESDPSDPRTLVTVRGLGYKALA
ncbi:MAG TPA: response regulator transcription factor [Acidimicrobiales bacterium]|jgi:DNA-binding response OmpR family regulator|nr:response regulator transcription factor [Acidimicrobiales bacterium]